LYRNIREQFERITDPKRIIDTDQRLEECVEKAGAYLEGELGA
jgi:hypothetical protein